MEFTPPTFQCPQILPASCENLSAKVFRMRYEPPPELKRNISALFDHNSDDSSQEKTFRMVLLDARASTSLEKAARNEQLLSISRHDDGALEIEVKLKKEKKDSSSLNGSSGLWVIEGKRGNKKSQEPWLQIGEFLVLPFWLSLGDIYEMWRTLCIRHNLFRKGVSYSQGVDFDFQAMIESLELLLVDISNFIYFGLQDQCIIEPWDISSPLEAFTLICTGTATRRKPQLSAKMAQLVRQLIELIDTVPLIPNALRERWGNMINQAICDCDSFSFDSNMTAQEMEIIFHLDTAIKEVESLSVGAVIHGGRLGPFHSIPEIYELWVGHILENIFFIFFDRNRDYIDSIPNESVTSFGITSIVPDIGSLATNTQFFCHRHSNAKFALIEGHKVSDGNNKHKSPDFLILFESDVLMVSIIADAAIQDGKMPTNLQEYSKFSGNKSKANSYIECIKSARGNRSQKDHQIYFWQISPNSMVYTGDLDQDMVIPMRPGNLSSITADICLHLERLMTT